MLTVLQSEDGCVSTVYSDRIAIGGASLADDDLWYWALFVVRPNGLDLNDDQPPLGGSASNRSDALKALCDRWRAWVESAGLAHCDRSLVE